MIIGFPSAPALRAPILGCPARQLPNVGPSARLRLHTRRRPVETCLGEQAQREIPRRSLGSLNAGETGVPLGLANALLDGGITPDQAGCDAPGNARSLFPAIQRHFDAGPLRLKRRQHHRHHAKIDVFELCGCGHRSCLFGPGTIALVTAYVGQFALGVNSYFEYNTKIIGAPPMTLPQRDARGRFVASVLSERERAALTAYYAALEVPQEPSDDAVHLPGAWTASVHPADAISATPPHLCAGCGIAKAPHAWLYCDDCSRDIEAEWVAAQDAADKELRDAIVRALGIAAALALVVGVIALACVL